ncbi:MAG: hypothetical protein J6P02_01175 [Lachnospiraceae bacterium]|nr:hypothetical protein [Lachnospiraceae bacterium]
MMNIFLKKFLVISLLLCEILCYNMFCAIVSDNDGSAFISKAEYDSLKSGFQSQINQYNTSIDSKIDDAIGSYLAGIKVEMQKEVNTIFQSSDGILSANNNDLVWDEGQMSIYYREAFYRMKGNATRCGFVNFSFPGATAQLFTEKLIKNPDYTSGIAGWYGLCKTYQTATSYVFNNSNSNNFNVDLDTNCVLLWQKFNSKTNIDWISRGETSEMIHHNISGDGVNVYNDGSILFNNTTPYRSINEEKYKYIICAPISLNSKRFSNQTEIRDFYNDDSTTGHTKVETAIEALGTGNATLAYTTSATDEVSHMTMFYTSVPATVRSGYTCYEPYFGFVPNCNNYNKLWTDAFDSYISDFKKYETNVNVLKDTKDKEHLAITAGFPLVQVKDGDVVEIEVKFNDTTINYDMWFKMGTFSSTTEVTNNSVGCIKDISGGAASTLNNAIRINNGYAKLKITIPSDGYLFAKWCKAGNLANGGGVFITPASVMVSSKV